MITGNFKEILGGAALFTGELTGTIESVEVATPVDKPTSHRVLITTENGEAIVMLFMIRELMPDLFEVNDGEFSFDEEQLVGFEFSRIQEKDSNDLPVKDDKGYIKTTTTLNRPAPKPQPKGGSTKKK